MRGAAKTRLMQGKRLVAGSSPVAGLSDVVRTLRAFSRTLVAATASVWPGRSAVRRRPFASSWMRCLCGGCSPPKRGAASFVRVAASRRGVCGGHVADLVRTPGSPDRAAGQRRRPAGPRGARQAEAQPAASRPLDADGLRARRRGSLLREPSGPAGWPGLGVAFCCVGFSRRCSCTARVSRSRRRDGHRQRSLRAARSYDTIGSYRP